MAVYVDYEEVEVAGEDARAPRGGRRRASRGGETRASRGVEPTPQQSGRYALAKCRDCGVEFVYERGKGPARQLCDDCRRESDRRRQRESHKRRLTCGDSMDAIAHAIRNATPISDSSIMTAKTKPHGTSDIRWRMELRRRMYSKDAAAALPDPRWISRW